MRARGSPPLADKWEKPQWPWPKWQAKWKQFLLRQGRAAVTRARYATPDRTLCVCVCVCIGYKDLTHKTIGISLLAVLTSGVCCWPMGKPYQSQMNVHLYLREKFAMCLFYPALLFPVLCGMCLWTLLVVAGVWNAWEGRPRKWTLDNDSKHGCGFIPFKEQCQGPSPSITSVLRGCVSN